MAKTLWSFGRSECKRVKVFAAKNVVSPHFNCGYLKPHQGSQICFIRFKTRYSFWGIMETVELVQMLPSVVSDQE